MRNRVIIAPKQLEIRIKKRKSWHKFELSSINSLKNKIIIVSLHHLLIRIIHTKLGKMRYLLT